MDFEQMLFHDLDWSFAAEIGLRTLVMFTVILLLLRLSGKKGVRQLSIFEVAIVIGLGSAAGDPMSNEQNAIVPALIVFSTILLFYRFITWLASRSEKFESVLEGDPIYVIEDGSIRAEQHPDGLCEGRVLLRDAPTVHRACGPSANGNPRDQRFGQLFLLR